MEKIAVPEMANAVVPLILMRTSAGRSGFPFDAGIPVTATCTVPFGFLVKVMRPCSEKMFATWNVRSPRKSRTSLVVVKRSIRIGASPGTVMVVVAGI